MNKDKTCPTCHLRIPLDDRELALSITISEYHVRCERCQWPVAKKIMPDDGICHICKKRQR